MVNKIENSVSNICWNCGKLIPLSTGKRKRHYCNDACRISYRRKTEQMVTKSKTEHSKPNNFEKCRYCGCDLPKLSMPRKYPGACLSCVMEQPGKSPDRDLPVYDCKDRKLTIMERLFYRPASELKSGEHNFVSLPGRACYGVYQ